MYKSTSEKAPYLSIGLWDLPNELRIKLNNSFNDKLFRILLKFYTFQSILASELNADVRSISYWWRENAAIPILILRKMKKIMNKLGYKKFCNKIENNVSSLGATTNRVGKAGMGAKPISIILPLLIDENLVRVTELIRTDGHMQPNLTRTRFTNKDYFLIEDFVSCAAKVFGKDKITVYDRKNDAWDANICGKPIVILISKLFDIPVGYKSNLIRIPLIIKNSPKSVKKVALMSYFDAEGTVSRNRFLIGLRSDSRNFLEDIQEMLLEFNIKSKIEKRYKNLYITGKDNIVNFYNNINFTQVKRKKRLKDFIEKYELLHYCTNNEISNKIINILNKSKNKWVRLIDLETMLNRKNCTVWGYLDKLVKNKKIEKRLIREGKTTFCEVSLI